jgi:all-trans-retinol dehydrogenase (NAD+)
MKVDGKIALITGSASGIGREMAMILGAKGCRLVLWDLDEGKLAETAEEIKTKTGADVTAHAIDLTSKSQIYDRAAEVQTAVGDPDILINNAGIVTGGLFLDSADEKNELTFKVNVFAHMWTIKKFLPAMLKKNSGHIIGVASMASHFGIAGQVDYAASKFASRGLMEALTAELKGMKGVTGVKTTTICPGRHHVQMSPPTFCNRRLVLPNVAFYQVRWKRLCSRDLEKEVLEACSCSRLKR